MRIVDRKTFLTLPAGTVFAKHRAVDGVRPEQSLCFDEVAIKGDTVAGVDFVVQDLFPMPEDCNDSSEWSDAIGAAFDGVETAPLDFECSARDGLFDQDQLFAVFSLEDQRRLVARLQAALDMVERAGEVKA
jgi:hypothetical protein